MTSGRAGEGRIIQSNTQEQIMTKTSVDEPKVVSHGK